MKIDYIFLVLLKQLIIVIKKKKREKLVSYLLNFLKANTPIMKNTVE